jgi:hypothetical protein
MIQWLTGKMNGWEDKWIDGWLDGQNGQGISRLIYVYLRYDCLTLRYPKCPQTKQSSLFSPHTKHFGNYDSLTLPTS